MGEQVTDAVTLGLIHACEVILPSGIAAYSAHCALRAARTSAVVKENLDVVDKKLDGILANRVEAAGDIGYAKGKEAGRDQERKNGQ